MWLSTVTENLAFKKWFGSCLHGLDSSVETQSAGIRFKQAEFKPRFGAWLKAHFFRLQYFWKTSANDILSQHCKHAVFLSLSKYGCHQVTPQGRNMQQSVSWNSSTYSKKGTLDTAGSVNPQLHFFFPEQSTTPHWQHKSTLTVAIYAAAWNKETKKNSPKQRTGVLGHYMK